MRGSRKTALGKKSSVKTYDYLEARGKRGNLKHIRKILKKVPNKMPESFDKI